MSYARSVFFSTIVLIGSFPAVIQAQSPDTGCSAIVARPNQQIGGANLSQFTPWGGQSGWTRDVSADPVDPNSAAWVTSVQAGGTPGIYADPVVKTVVVTAGQTRVETPINGYPTVSDPGPFPIPLPPIIQGVQGNNYKVRGDKHLTIIDKDNCVLYELYNAQYDPATNTIAAGTSAVWDLTAGDHQRPYGWVGGTVSGLPWSLHALRYDEVASGQIRHALTFAARDAWGRSAFTDLASAHQYGMPNQATLPPFGARARLKANFDVTGFAPNIQVVLNALKQYGMIYTDGSRPIDLHMEVDDRWEQSELSQLRKVLFNNDNFEFIQTGPIYNDPMYGSATAPPKGPAPVISSFTADNATVPAGTAVALSWAVTGASSRIRIITPGVGPIVSDSVIVTPAQTTTYTLAVENSFGISRSTVTVNVEQGSCAAALPTVSLSPASQDLAAGQTASFLVSVTNADSSGCVGERFVLSHTLPLGWTGAYDSPALTIAPGETATATLTVVAPLDGARGDTPITAAVSGMGGTASQAAHVSFVPRQALSLTLSANTVGGGKPAKGTVTLANPAPSGGAEVSLLSSDPSATIPASVTIPEGSLSATFPITTVPVATSATVKISASYLDLSRKANLRVDPAALWFIGIARTVIDGGTSTGGNNVFMTGAVLADTTVTMTSSDPSVASVPDTVLILAGTTQSSYKISTNPVAAETKVKITATLGDVSNTQTITVKPNPANPVLSDMTLGLATIDGGFFSARNIVVLSAPATKDVDISLSSSDPAAVVPDTVTIPAGSASAAFTIGTNPVDAPVDVTITARHRGTSITRTVTVSPSAH